MPTTVIFGGYGKVARQLTRILISETLPAHEVHGIIRNLDQSSELVALGAKPIVQSIEDTTVADIVSTLRTAKPDVVIWAAGAGSDKEDAAAHVHTVDRDGAIKVMDACVDAGVKRLITISALDVRDRARPMPDWYDEGTKERTARIWAAIEPFMEAKLAADKELVIGNSRRKLDFTIIRPGGLGSKPGSGTISAGKVQLANVIKRDDLARVIPSV